MFLILSQKTVFLQLLLLQLLPLIQVFDNDIQYLRYLTYGNKLKNNKMYSFFPSSIINIELQKVLKAKLI